MITAVDFCEGEVSVACRLLTPEGFGSSAYAKLGRFGKAPDGALRRALSLFRRDMYINAANTALLHWQKRLFALYEGSLPTEIDPYSLETLGGTDLGIIRRAFAAHPKLHRPSGAIINQGVRSPSRPHLDYYELNRNGAARLIASTPFSGSILTHDFAVTDRFIISICSPLFVDPSAILIKGQGPSQALRWQPDRGTEILITPVDGSTPAKRIVGDAFFYSHTANSYEDGEDIIIHGAVAPDASGVDWVGSIRADADALAPSASGYLTELRINPARGRVSRRTIAEVALDYPTIDPRQQGARHTIVYGAGFRNEDYAYADLFDAIVKVDIARDAVTKTVFGEGHFVSEPLFAPRLGSNREDDGWLLCLNYDFNCDESYVAIMTARDTPQLVASIPLGQPLPLSFHGLWVGRLELSGPRA
jgi:all-trans-8'-apo-beta-carotenal 15,15'-oxygenase